MRHSGNKLLIEFKLQTQQKDKSLQNRGFLYRMSKYGWRIQKISLICLNVHLFEIR